MPIILAIEPDRRQAAHVSAIVRHRVGAELILADTTEAALDAIGSRVPDLVLVPALQPLGRVGALDIEVGPFAPDEVARLVERAVGEPLPDAVVARVLEASGGHAGIACHVTRQLVDAVRRGTAGRFEPERDVDLGLRLAQAFAKLPSATRQALARLKNGP